MEYILHGLVLKPEYLKDQYIFDFMLIISLITTNFKLFADETSVFSVVHKMNTSTINLNNDLNKIRNWAIQLKMNFNRDPSKQAQEVIFSIKLQKKNHNSVYFNHNLVQQVLSEKHLRMYIGTKSNFWEHLNNVQNIWIIA